MPIANAVDRPVTNTTVATGLMLSLFGEQGSWLAVLVVAPLIWVFGEIVPKSVFQQRADVITPYAIFGLRFFSYLFYPLIFVFSRVARFGTRIAGGGDTPQNMVGQPQQQLFGFSQMPP
mgnify:CR=1 FL=1